MWKISRYLGFLGFSLIIIIVGMAISSPFSLKTTNDVEVLDRILLQRGFSNVLGVDSQGELEFYRKCPDHKPVIGWITHFGEKIILSELPEGETPSACFISTKEAVKNGFKEE